MNVAICMLMPLSIFSTRSHKKPVVTARKSRSPCMSIMSRPSSDLDVDRMAITLASAKTVAAKSVKFQKLHK